VEEDIIFVEETDPALNNQIDATYSGTEPTLPSSVSHIVSLKPYISTIILVSHLIIT
jgi:hypothetical protein